MIRRRGHRRRGHPPWLRLPVRERRLRRAVEKSGFVFIGPARDHPPDGRQGLGQGCDEGRRRALRAGFATAPWRRPEEIVKIAARIGYPVIIKAAGGGGGRGMRVVHTEARCSTRSPDPRRGQAAFGNPWSSHGSSSRTRATSRSRCSPTSTATRSSSASATARCSAATRRSSRSAGPGESPPRSPGSASAAPTPAARSATAAPAPSSSSTRTASSTSSR